MANKRIQYLDLAKGLSIILVVLYHICIHQHDRPYAVKLLPVFLMPLYFFLSGLFFKEYESFGGFLLRKVNKVLIPFAFFYLTTSFVLPNILNLFGFTVAATQSLGISGLWAFITDEKFANNPIWFLWALFLINIYFYVILVLTKHLTSNPTYEAVTLTVVSFAVQRAAAAVLPAASALSSVFPQKSAGACSLPSGNRSALFALRSF